MIFRHFTNTLAFAVVASIVFMLWSIKYHKVTRYWESNVSDTIVKFIVITFVKKFNGNIGGRLPDPVERFVGGRGLLASSLFMSPLCHHGTLAAQPE